MEYTWSRAFADGREAALMGGDAGRLLDACRRLSSAGAKTASGLVEAPLLGVPEYDALVIHNPRGLLSGCLVADSSLTQAQEVLDWAAQRKPYPPYIFFELDAAGSGSLSGIHCKIEGNLKLAEAFFRTVGEPERSKAFLRLADRLPEGWYARHAGVFPGRDINSTRMEVEPFTPEARQALSDPTYVRRWLDELGFTAYDDIMCSDIARLAAVDTPISVQFDFLPDGTFLPVLSLLSMYENVRPDCGPLFAEDGALRRLCLLYQEMGVSDGRWRLLEPCLFSARRGFRMPDGGIELSFHHCFPCGTKAKWRESRRTSAKFYLLLDASRVPFDPEKIG